MIAKLLGGVALLAVLAAGVQTWRIDRLQDSAEESRERIAELELLRRADGGVIADLREANRSLADAARADETAAAEAAARLQAERDRLAADLERERKRRADIYRSDTDAKSWADAAVPAAVARSLSGAD